MDYKNFKTDTGITFKRQMYVTVKKKSKIKRIQKKKILNYDFRDDT